MNNKPEIKIKFVSVFATQDEAIQVEIEISHNGENGYYKMLYPCRQVEDLKLIEVIELTNISLTKMLVNTARKK